MVGADRNLFVRKGGASQKKTGKHCSKSALNMFRKEKSKRAA